MVEVGQAVCFLLISLGAGLITHTLVRHGKGGWAAGLLVFFGGTGTILYLMMPSVGIIGALGLAILTFMIFLPVTLGMAMGMLVGNWSRRS